jgi:hypothetical protein
VIERSASESTAMRPNPSRSSVGQRRGFAESLEFLPPLVIGSSPRTPCHCLLGPPVRRELLARPGKGRVPAVTADACWDSRAQM